MRMKNKTSGSLSGKILFSAMLTATLIPMCSLASEGSPVVLSARNLSGG